MVNVLVGTSQAKKKTPDTVLSGPDYGSTVIAHRDDGDDVQNSSWLSPWTNWAVQVGGEAVDAANQIGAKVEEARVSALGRFDAGIKALNGMGDRAAATIEGAQSSIVDRIAESRAGQAVGTARDAAAQKLSQGVAATTDLGGKAAGSLEDAARHLAQTEAGRTVTTTVGTSLAAAERARAQAVGSLDSGIKAANARVDALEQRLAVTAPQTDEERFHSDMREMPGIHDIAPGVTEEQAPALFRLARLKDAWGATDDAVVKLKMDAQLTGGQMLNPAAYDAAVKAQTDAEAKFRAGYESVRSEGKLGDVQDYLTQHHRNFLQQVGREANITGDAISSAGQQIAAGAFSMPYYLSDGGNWLTNKVTGHRIYSGSAGDASHDWAMGKLDWMNGDLAQDKTANERKAVEIGATVVTVATIVESAPAVIRSGMSLLNKTRQGFSTWVNGGKIVKEIESATPGVDPGIAALASHSPAPTGAAPAAAVAKTADEAAPAITTNYSAPAIEAPAAKVVSDAPHITPETNLLPAAQPAAANAAASSVDPVAAGMAKSSATPSDIAASRAAARGDEMAAPPASPVQPPVVNAAEVDDILAKARAADRGSVAEAPAVTSNYDNLGSGFYQPAPQTPTGPLARAQQESLDRALAERPAAAQATAPARNRVEDAWDASRQDAAATRNGATEPPAATVPEDPSIRAHEDAMRAARLREANARADGAEAQADAVRNGQTPPQGPSAEDLAHRSRIQDEELRAARAKANAEEHNERTARANRDRAEAGPQPRDPNAPNDGTAPQPGPRRVSWIEANRIMRKESLDSSLKLLENTGYEQQALSYARARGIEKTERDRILEGPLNVYSQAVKNYVRDAYMARNEKGVLGWSPVDAIMARMSYWGKYPMSTIIPTPESLLSRAGRVVWDGLSLPVRPALAAKDVWRTNGMGAKIGRAMGHAGHGAVGIGAVALDQATGGHVYNAVTAAIEGVGNKADKTLSAKGDEVGGLGGEALKGAGSAISGTTAAVGQYWQATGHAVADEMGITPAAAPTPSGGPGAEGGDDPDKGKDGKEDMQAVLDRMWQVSKNNPLMAGAMLYGFFSADTWGGSLKNMLGLALLVKFFDYGVKWLYGANLEAGASNILGQGSDMVMAKVAPKLTGNGDASKPDDDAADHIAQTRDATADQLAAQQQQLMPGMGSSTPTPAPVY